METVQVALRIRPLSDNEIKMACQPCLERIPNEHQVKVGKGNVFYSFNYVFDELEGQNEVYNTSVKPLIENLFKGYNLTILAYGQTGSGKTYTMGTNYDGCGEMGIIPRAVNEIFEKIQVMDNYKFDVSVSFLELYNESLYDLLTHKPRESSLVDLREINNGICIPGLTDVKVDDPNSVLGILNEGSLGRTVGATAMNAESSRSHAIFTLNIRIIPNNDENGVMTSSFRLVDLAGSERSKKTCTTGERFKEGVNINKGLLVLGNVISQLGEGNQNFVSYRDSKLTRLLQDSLGGNSVTLMIACVSPADYNCEETMSTLRYADRVRKIKNKPVVNQDPKTAEICRLRKENEELRLKIVHNVECPPDHKFLQAQLNEARSKLKLFDGVLTETLWNYSKIHEKSVLAEQFENNIKEKLEELNKLSVSSSQSNESNCGLLNEISIKIKQVQDEYAKAEKELLKHDEHSSVRESDDNDEHGEPSPIKHEFTLSQAKINQEILNLNKDLIWKEKLMAAYREDAEDVKNVSQVVEDLKKQIDDLHKEKEELLQQLTNGSSASSKVAEQRRKRLQELEPKVASLIKKVNEQERILKRKQNTEAKLKTLKDEISELKKAKVRMIKQLKVDNEKFQEWKTAKNKEVLTLKNQNIKKQNELKKLELAHCKQQNVLKIKLEAAVAANKRLVANLERQSQAKVNRLKGPASQLIREKINEDLEMMDSAYQAHKSLENLMLDRAHLNRELSNLEANLENAAASEEDTNKLKEEKKELEEELSLRNTEIADLQQKLLGVQLEGDKCDWSMIKSISDGKMALNYMRSILIEKIKDYVDLEDQFSDHLEHCYQSQERAHSPERASEGETTAKKKSLSKKEEKDDSKIKSRRTDANQFEVADEESLKAFDDSLDIDSDNVENDPDWTKTPLYKKLQSFKIKRNQQSNKCICSGNCGRKCSCKRMKKCCSEQCSCDLSVCANNSEKSLTEGINVSPTKRSSEGFPDLFADCRPKKKKMYFDFPDS